MKIFRQKIDKVDDEILRLLKARKDIIIEKLLNLKKRDKLLTYQR